MAAPLRAQSCLDQASRLHVLREQKLLDVLFALLAVTAFVMLGITLADRNRNSAIDDVIGSSAVCTLLGCTLTYLDHQVRRNSMSARLALCLLACGMLLMMLCTATFVFGK